MISMSRDRYAALLLRYRWAVVAVTTAIMLALAAGAPGVTVSGSYRVLFGEDNPYLLTFDKLQDTYSASRSALIAIAPAEGSVFTRETLAAIEDLTEAAWQTPHSVRVDSLTNYFHTQADGDDLMIAPLVEDAGSFDDSDLERVRSTALGEKELIGQLVSEDGRVAGMIISFALTEPEEPKWAEISDYLGMLLNDARAAHPDLSFYLTGNVILNQTFEDAGKDAEELIPVVFVVILTIAALLLRSLYATLSIAVIIVFVVLSTMGIAGWLGVVLTPVSASVPVIIMAVAVAHAIHIVTITQMGIRRGLERNAALRESLRENLYPVSLASVTTAIGFLSLNTSNSPPFHVLGNMVAVGMLFTFIYSIVLLPALLSVLPMGAPRLRSGRENVFERLGELRRRAPHGDSVVRPARGRGAGDRHSPERDGRQLAPSLRRALRVPHRYGVHRRESDGARPDRILPEFRERRRNHRSRLPENAVEAFAEWYRDQPEVLYVQAFPDIMKRVNRSMHGDDPAFYRIPDAPELAAQLLLIYEFSLPFGADLNDRMDIAKSATRMTVVLDNTSTRDHIDIAARARDWLEANAPGIAGPASGFTMISAHLSDQNVNSMLLGTIVATGLISLILLLVFRSIRIGLICLVPNFVPAILAFGLWGHLAGTIGLGASVVTAIAIGIIVDDTIHFLTRYLKARRQGQSSPEAVRDTFRHVGPALWATTAILVAGFLVFSLSGYEPSWVLGILVAMTILFALIADLLLLPALLMAIDRRNP